LDHLPAEHRNLVPQHQQLRVVGRRAPCQQHQPSQQLAEDQIEQSKRHPSIIGASVSSANTQLRAYGRLSGTHKLFDVAV